MNRFLFLKAIFIVAYLAITVPVNAQNQLDWVKDIGGSGLDQGNAITTDTAGNVYTTGTFIGTVDFDPGPGVVNLTAAGGGDIFITKMDAAGHLIWVRNFGSTAGKASVGNGIAVDVAGNIYITGLFAGKVDFNPSTAVADTFYLKSGSLSTLYWLSAYALKLDSAGKFVWVQAWGNTLTTDGISNGIAVDTKGDNVYVVGKQYATGKGSITRLNAIGAIVWTVAPLVNSSTTLIGKGVVVGKAGDVYVTGQNAFFKLDTAGNVKWMKDIGSTCNAIAMDTVDNIHITGTFPRNGSVPVDFDPGPGVFNFPYNGTVNNLFVAKYDSSGAFLWAKAIGELTPATTPYSITTDVARNVYFIGSYTGTVDFDPGANVLSFTTATNKINSFIVKINSLGDLVWAISNRAQNTGTGVGYGITVDRKSRAVYATGYFMDSTFFTSPTDTIPFNSNVSTGTTRTQDIFIYKMSQSCNTATNLPVIACESYKYNGQAYNASGTYTHTFANAEGCDSVINLKLTISHPVSTPLSANACKGYTLNGQLYTTTGNYTQKYTSAGGCDSTVTLNLTIDTTFSNLVVTSCDSFTLNGQTYTTTGIYKQVFTSAAGCDSMLILNLTINITPNATITKNDITLMAGNATAYQWINCDSNKAITGATLKTFTPKKNGNYAVVVSGNGTCSDTSDCIAITGIAGIDEVEYTNNFYLFPNPAKDIIYVQSNVPLHYASVRMIDILGKEIMAHNNINGSMFTIDLTQYTPGIYLLEIKEMDDVSRIKLVKE